MSAWAAQATATDAGPFNDNSANIQSIGPSHWHQPSSSHSLSLSHVQQLSPDAFSVGATRSSVAPSGAGPSSDSLGPSYGQSTSDRLRLSPNSSSRQSSSSATSAKSAEEAEAGPGEASHEQTEAAFQTTFYDPFRIKHRRRTTPAQLKVLEGHFVVNAKPDVGLRKALADELSMTPREVQVWFQNRRAKTKKLREKAEKDGDDVGDHSPEALAPQPAPNHLPGHAGPFGGQQNDLQSLRRGSSPAVLSHVGGQYLDHPDQSQQPQHAQFSQPYYAQQTQQQIQPQQYGQPQYIPQHPIHNGAYTVSPSHSPENSFNGSSHAAPLDSLELHSQIDANGRRFSLPAYHYDARPQPNAYGQLPHQPALYGGQQLDPHALEEAFAPSSANTSPNFGAFSNDNLRGDGDFSPSSSADELSSATLDYSSYSQPPGVYPIAGYSFGSAAPVAMQEPMTPVFLPQAQDLSLSPDGFDGGRRSSCPPEFNAAFNGLGLTSPQQPSPVWPPPQTVGFLPPQLPNGAQLNPAAHPALLQKRHSVANGHLPGVGLGGTYNLQTGQFIPASSSQQQQQQPAYALRVSGQQPQPYAPGSFLHTNLPAGIGASLASRRGSTSSLLGTIAEQPGPPVSTRLAYGLTAEDYAVVEGGSVSPEQQNNAYPQLERRGSLVGPAANGAAVARKARSQQSLRSSPYGQDPNRRSPGLSQQQQLQQNERTISSNGLEYSTPY